MQNELNSIFSRVVFSIVSYSLHYEYKKTATSFSARIRWSWNIIWKLLENLNGKDTAGTMLSGGSPFALRWEAGTVANLILSF